MAKVVTVGAKAVDVILQVTAAGASGTDLRPATEWWDAYGERLRLLPEAARLGINSQDDLYEAVLQGKNIMPELTKAMDDYTARAVAAAKGTVDLSLEQRDATYAANELSNKTTILSKDVREDADALAAAKLATSNLNEQMAILNGTISQKKLWDDYATALWNYKDGAGDTAGELDTLRLAAANVVLALKDMPEQQKTEIIAQINQGDIDTVNAILANYAKGINVPLRFQGQGDVGFMKNATGTSFNPGGPTLVHRDEIINMPRGASVTPAGQAQKMRQRGGGGQIGTVIVQTNDPPRRWLDELSWRVS
jgi:hypothetical protein